MTAAAAVRRCVSFCAASEYFADRSIDLPIDWEYATRFSENQDMATTRARKLLADSRLEGFEIRATSKGTGFKAGKSGRLVSALGCVASLMISMPPTS